MSASPTFNTLGALLSYPRAFALVLHTAFLTLPLPSNLCLNNALSRRHSWLSYLKLQLSLSKKMIEIRKKPFLKLKQKRRLCKSRRWYRKRSMAKRRKIPVLPSSSVLGHHNSEGRPYAFQRVPRKNWLECCATISSPWFLRGSCGNGEQQPLVLTVLVKSRSSKLWRCSAPWSGQGQHPEERRRLTLD